MSGRSGKSTGGDDGATPEPRDGDPKPEKPANPEQAEPEKRQAETAAGDVADDLADFA